ncbi:MAG: 4-(cytidine 5'-diphospho)-2-C-methyl-D-erythritol kinase [Desulfovibrionaceae bacterium]
MRPVTLIAPAKVNLALHITGMRPNGYHELDSIFWPLDSPCDLLHLAAGAGPGLSMTCSEPDIDCASNTLTRAYTLFREATGWAPALSLRLEKHIPHGAGLGGGSSDAASLLRWLNEHAPRPLPPEALNALTAGVGADVPFFLHARPCRVRGIGEVIEPFPENWLAGYALLLLCPSVRVSTPWAYRAWDALPAAEKAPGDLTSALLACRKTSSCGTWLHNDLEAAVFPAYPLLRQLKGQLLERGAAAAVMSGSGSSIVGIFRTPEDAALASMSFADAVSVRHVQQL